MTWKYLEVGQLARRKLFQSVYINTILIGLITGIGLVIAGFLTKFISDVSLIYEYYIKIKGERYNSLYPGFNGAFD